MVLVAASMAWFIPRGSQGYGHANDGQYEMYRSESKDAVPVRDPAHDVKVDDGRVYVKGTDMSGVIGADGKAFWVESSPGCTFSGHVNLAGRVGGTTMCTGGPEGSFIMVRVSCGGCTAIDLPAAPETHYFHSGTDIVVPHGVNQFYNFTIPYNAVVGLSLIVDPDTTLSGGVVEPKAIVDGKVVGPTASYLHVSDYDSDMARLAAGDWTLFFTCTQQAPCSGQFDDWAFY